MIIAKKTTTVLSALTVLLTLTISGCKTLTQAEPVCVDDKLLYEMADKRTIDETLVAKGLSCANEHTVNTTMLSLGRIGGDKVAAYIMSQLQHTSEKVREQAAFAVGISLAPFTVPALVDFLKLEQSPLVQQQLAIAIGNLGHKDSASHLIDIINQPSSEQAAKGAMKGLAILSTFHRDKLTDTKKLNIEKVIGYLQSPVTRLEASFLLARIPLLNPSHKQPLKKVMQSFAQNRLEDDSQANLVKALSAISDLDDFDYFYQRATGSDIGLYVTAIQALGKLPLGTDQQIDKMNHLLMSGDTIQRLTLLQSAAKWVTTENLQLLLEHPDSLIQAAAFTAANHPKPLDFQRIAYTWLESDDPNLQRVAVDYAAKRGDKVLLEHLANSEKVIIANGAKTALGTYQEPQSKALVTPETLPELNVKVELVTTQGVMVFGLNQDTPYTSANFINLVEQGFYHNTYFHRVIAHFVAQGGTQHGDGSGSVNHTIREELSNRSHLIGSVGMATAGKDTAGGQFFINLAPNLHLDSNYTIFATVEKGMDVALKLQQNDKILTARIIK